MQTDYSMILIIRDDILRRGSIKQDSASNPVWIDFFEAYDPIIRKFARTNGLTNDTAIDECTQEVWLAILKGLKHFVAEPEHGRFRTWVYSIVQRKTIDLFRIRAKTSGLSLNDSEQKLPTPVDQSDGPVEVVQAEFARGVLKEVLEELKSRVSEQSFDIFYARRFERRRVAEVASQFEVSPQVVRVCHHRVEKRLERMLRQRLGDI